MHLHKLLYNAHGWHSGIEGEPLLDEMVQAWDYGPDVPSIHYEFRDFGPSPIDRLAVRIRWEQGSVRMHVPHVDPDDESAGVILRRVRRVYAKRSGVELSRLINVPQTPRSETRRKYPKIRRVVTPNEAIQAYFETRVRQERDAA